MSYRDMARVYDRLMEDAPYSSWVSFTKDQMHHHGITGSRILDVGCGTGEITHRLDQEGYQMTGVDLSEEMLAVAQQKNPRSSIQWLKQDMTELEFPVSFDTVISYCDVFNYLQEPEQVKASFNRVHAALEEGGLFLFDVHSIDHIQRDLSGSTFAEVYDDLSYVWFCDPGEKENSIVHDLTFFIQEGAGYHRFDEVHDQQGFELRDLKAWLEEAGFSFQGVYADFSTEPDAEGDRWLIACTK
ncbi:class I SAM-dependent DNA methyltransferase [Halobacillus litoralis]|uniref:class I SAM-dependent DNA methyltransferase n=1 Tax=Halobacillus litoralis TaxID=45668 RepID=UPI001F3E58DE|nr:class I SAM-dependent methyltransferase [Halobacillus litoralis]